MNINALPGELPEHANPDEAEAWLRQYTAAVGYDFGWTSNLTKRNVTDSTTGTIDQQGTQRLHAAQPSKQRAVKILTKAERDPGQIFDDALDKGGGTGTSGCVRKGEAMSEETTDSDNPQPNQARDFAVVNMLIEAGRFHEATPAPCDDNPKLTVWKSTWSCAQYKNVGCTLTMPSELYNELRAKVCDRDASIQDKAFLEAALPHINEGTVGLDTDAPAGMTPFG